MILLYRLHFPFSFKLRLASAKLFQSGKATYPANICIDNSTMADSHDHAIATAEHLL